jgi:hypothetical protein
MFMSDHVSLLHAPLAAWPLAVGLLLNSTILFGNIALSIVGPVPIVLGYLGPSGLRIKDRVRVWSLFLQTIDVGGPLVREFLS